MEDVRAYLDAYYASHDEHSRLAVRRAGIVEYETTMRYIRRYLTAGMRVLEIGAGTGRYSHALAQRGWQVDAVELVEHNIRRFEALTQPDEPVTVRQGSADDLGFFEDDSYDLTLLLGPMYHLFTEKEKKAALCEAVRVTKPGGVVIAAYCMADASILGFGFLRGNIRYLLENGMLDEQFNAISRPQDLFVMHRVEDIAALRSPLPVQPLMMVAADGMSHHMGEALENMDEESFSHFLRYHFAVCERQELLGWSNHVLDIFKKLN